MLQLETDMFLFSLFMVDYYKFRANKFLFKMIMFFNLYVLNFFINFQ